jgi:hypothetical protein
LQALLTGPGSLKLNARPFLEPQVSSDTQGEAGWRITQVDFEGALQSYEEHRRQQAKPLNRLLRHSSLLQMAQHLLEGLRTRGYLHELATDVPTPAFQASQYDLATVGVYYCDEPPEYVQAWDVTRHLLVRLNRDVRAAGARLLVMSVPAIEEIDEDVMSRVVRDSAQADRLCLEEAPAHRQLGELLRELDIDYLDLLPAFRDARRQTGVELFRSDKHWNPQGHALAARELAAALEHRRYLVSPVASISGDKGKALFR